VTASLPKRGMPDRQPIPEPESADVRFVGVVLIACSLSLFVFFRHFVLSSFDLINGDAGDSRLLIVILEHWGNVFHGRAELASPPYFAPERGMLGYSESIFLFSLPYAAARALGLDRYLAFETMLVVLRAIGFWAMYALLRTLRVDRWIALLGAVLFTISNAYYLAAGHSQFAAIAFVPVLCLLVVAYWRSHERGNPARARLYLVFSAILLALLLFTSFYVAWFVIFLAGLWSTLLFIAVALRHRRLPISRVRSGAIADGALASLVFLVTLTPFLVVYLPTAIQTGGRQFNEVLSFTPRLADVVNVGAANVVWGSILANLFSGDGQLVPFAAYELQRGWPPLILVVFVVTTVVFLQGAVRTAHAVPAIDDSPYLGGSVLGSTAVLGWLMSVQIGGYTPWWLVFRFVPGALAIRVPVRINLVINFLVIVVAMFGLGYLKKRAAASSAWGSRSAGAVVAVLAIALVAEQLNAVSTSRLSRTAETELFEHIERVPSRCHYFYVLRPDPQEDLYQAVITQTQAMLVAIEQHLPTINGYSGNFPPGWNLFLPNGEYPKHVAEWISAKGMAEGVCSLDLSTGRWSQVNGH